MPRSLPGLFSYAPRALRLNVFVHSIFALYIGQSPSRQWNCVSVESAPEAAVALDPADTVDRMRSM